MKIVIVHHLNDAQHYLFGVPEERDLKKDDLVLIRNSRGEVPAVCVCDSFSVPENVLEQLQKMYEDANIPAEACAEYRKFEDELIRDGMSLQHVLDLLKAEKEEAK